MCTRRRAHKPQLRRPTDDSATEPREADTHPQGRPGSLVGRASPRPALATAAGCVRDLDLGGHAPADARGNREGLLRAVPAAFPDRGGPGGRVPNGGAEGMGRHGVLPPRQEPARGGEADRDGLRRPAAADRRRASASAGDRGLHGRGGCQHRLRRRRAGTGRQRHPGAVPSVPRPGGPGRRESSEEAAGLGRRPDPAGRGWAIQPGDDGPGRHDLPPAASSTCCPERPRAGRCPTTTLRPA